MEPLSIAIGITAGLFLPKLIEVVRGPIIPSSAQYEAQRKMQEMADKQLKRRREIDSYNEWLDKQQTPTTPSSSSRQP